jgi:hypothetical protein
VSVTRTEGVDLVVATAKYLHALEELLAIVQALTALRKVHGVVLDQSSRPPDAVLENRLESVWAGNVIKTEVRKIEIGGVALSREVVPRFFHSHLH